LKDGKLSHNGKRQATIASWADLSTWSEFVYRPYPTPETAVPEVSPRT